MPQCAFYGFRWPERSLQLFHVGGNECGLDWEGNGPCQLEMEGQTPSYYRCPRVFRMRDQLWVARSQIEFRAPAGNTTLEKWELENWARLERIKPGRVGV
jgi:hypothetical protein